MSFTNYCVNYLMKIDIIHVFDRAIKRLKHGFVINAHHKFNPRSINAITAARHLAFMSSLSAPGIEPGPPAHERTCVGAAN